MFFKLIVGQVAQSFCQRCLIAQFFCRTIGIIKKTQVIFFCIACTAFNNI